MEDSLNPLHDMGARFRPGRIFLPVGCQTGPVHAASEREQDSTQSRADRSEQRPMPPALPRALGPTYQAGASAPPAPTGPAGAYDEDIDWRRWAYLTYSPDYEIG